MSDLSSQSPRENGRGSVVLQALTAVVVLSAMVVLALRMTVAPNSKPAASDRDFSIDRAFAHVKTIASQPHPAGSAANAKVREYLRNDLTSLGLKPEVQTATILRRAGEWQVVNNVIARLPGKTRKRPIMLAAHYDSVDGGPGAGDDTAGVAALLETARALRASGPLDREVILLITDGEERGLLGARGYFERHEADYWRSEIGLVMNFEARGTAGPSIMFETAPHNLSFIRLFASTSPYPIGNSLSYDVYRLLPNNTDFTVFRWAGLKGLNFAFIGNYFYYHTGKDSIENLDRDSLYHHGVSALALARRFGELSDEELDGLLSDHQPNAVYFNLWTTLLARYSANWIWPLSILQLLLAAFVLTRGFRRKSISPRGVGGAAIRLLLALFITPVAVYGMMSLVHPVGAPLAFNLQLSAVAILSTIITLAFGLEFRRIVRPLDLAASGIILFSILSIPVNIYLPGGSFITFWPTLFATAGFAAAAHFPATSWRLLPLCLLAAAPAVWLLVPLNVQVVTAMRLELAPVLSALIVLTVWLAMGAIAPAFAVRQEKAG